MCKSLYMGNPKEYLVRDIANYLAPGRPLLIYELFCGYRTKHLNPLRATVTIICVSVVSRLAVAVYALTVQYFAE